MVPTLSNEPSVFTPEQQQTLLHLALEAIDRGLRHSRHEPEVESLDGALRSERASFVTLQIDGRLRGCIGTLEAFQPLAVDVSANAWAAAFRDPRFPPVTQSEARRLDIHISVLSAPQPMVFASEADLLGQLRPFVDGLVLHEGMRRGTFLPSVWESLPEPSDFLAQLKRKAGLPGNYWSDTLRIARYTTSSIPG